MLWDIGSCLGIYIRGWWVCLCMCNRLSLGFLCLCFVSDSVVKRNMCEVYRVKLSQTLWILYGALVSICLVNVLIYLRWLLNCSLCMRKATPRLNAYKHVRPHLKAQTPKFPLKHINSLCLFQICVPRPEFSLRIYRLYSIVRIFIYWTGIVATVSRLCNASENLFIKKFSIYFWTFIGFLFKVPSTELVRLWILLPIGYKIYALYVWAIHACTYQHMYMYMYYIYLCLGNNRQQATSTDPKYRTVGTTKCKWFPNTKLWSHYMLSFITFKFLHRLYLNA